LSHDLVMSWCAHWHRLVALTALAVVCGGAAVAADAPSIPPGFLAYPPYNGFVFEAVHLLPERHDHLIVDEVDDYTFSRGMMDIMLAKAESFDDEFAQNEQEQKERKKQAQMTAVPSQFAAEFKAMQAAANGGAAYAMGKDLPEAIRLYTAASVDFHLAHPSTIERQPDLVLSKPLPAGPMDTEQLAALNKAIPRFQAVLDLPDAKRPPRAVAAAYMLGRSYALRGNLGDAALAEKAFVLTRSLARAGLPDPDGLAVASFGDQARLRRAEGDLASTIGLYGEQATRGSVEGIASLKWVAQALYLDQDGMTKVENIPLGQRLLIAYALEFNDDGRVREYVYAPGGHPNGNVDNGTMDLIVRTAKQWPKEKVAYPDRLAALAYRIGDFDFARTLITGQNTALAWWLEAKLLVTDGKLAEAEAAYKKVVAMSPASPDPDGLSPFNESAACDEMAQLERVRAEFIPAMRDQVACDRVYIGGGWGYGLTRYLAERVLSTSELRDFVTTLPPDPSSRASRVIDADSWMLHSALAKRLVREGHYKEAISYADAIHDVRVLSSDVSFDSGLSDSLKTQRDFIQAYATAHEQAEHASSAVARGAAWYQMALLTRVEHDQIMDHDAAIYKENATPEYPGVSSIELARLKENYTVPDQDNLRWYIAFDDALKAAQLVPPRSQAYAAILCHAAHWMNEAPPVGNSTAGLHEAWQLYVKHGAYVLRSERFGHQCPDPDFEAAAQPSWVHRLKRLIVRVHVHPMAAAAAALGLLAFALVLGVLLVRRKVDKKLPA
jgi:cellulose synthase operon protein C